MGRIGVAELAIVLAIALLIFGPAKLPKLGKAMGQTISNFKRGYTSAEDQITEHEGGANKGEQ